MRVLDFSYFFLHALRYQFETWYKHPVGGAAYRVKVSSQLEYCDSLYSQYIGQNPFSAFMA